MRVLQGIPTFTMPFHLFAKMSRCLGNNLFIKLKNWHFPCFFLNILLTRVLKNLNYIFSEYTNQWLLAGRSNTKKGLAQTSVQNPHTSITMRFYQYEIFKVVIIDFLMMIFGINSTHSNQYFSSLRQSDCICFE